MKTPEQRLLALTARPHFSQTQRQTAADPFVHLRSFLSVLGNPEKKIPHYIHLTGTSGKGSTVAYLSHIIQASGATVGLTVSPHIHTMRERWQINNAPISPRDFNRLVTHLTTAFKICVKRDPNFGLSFFDVCTALALTYFSEQKVTWAVVEVFNGGRVDPTTIIPHKDAAIITNIGLDHQHLLGNTKSKIAREKAGIITPNCLVFSNESNPRLKTQIKVASQKNNARFIHTPKPRQITVTSKGTTFVFKHERFRVSGIGEHQAQNAALAITVATALGFNKSAIRHGLHQTKLPLRFEIIRTSPLLILDAAHNPAKIRTTVLTYQQIRPSGPLCLILRFSATKNFQAMIRDLLTLKPSQIIITQVPGMPGTKSTELAKFFPKSKQKPLFINDPIKAWQQAQSFPNILVTGSIYLASFYANLHKN